MDKSRFRKLITDPSSLGIALLCCSFIFAAVEIRYPHFFMRGDNADWYLSEYIFSNRCILEGKFPLYCFNEFCGQRYFAFGSVIKCSVICVEMLSFALLYTVTPHIGRGVLFDTSKLYDYGFAEIIAGGRYVTFGYTSNSHLINKEVYDLSESLDYNLNKLYKINNVSGYVYDVISSNVIDDNECFDHMVYFSGSVFESWPDMLGQMREQSVCWYIVNPGSRTEFESCLDGYGLEYVSETAHSVIYYDPCSQPYAYDAEENKVDLTQDINSLVMHTADSFNGGKITLNYTYDPNFRCYIDGKPAELTNEPGKWQFYTECGPGEHEIIVRYEDQTFNVCCIITGAYIILAGAGIIVYTKIRKRSKTREVCS